MDNLFFIDRCKALIGLPYSECACDAIIRRALNICFKGTNWLFRSINNSSKYRYITERHACGDGTTPPPGAVVFKVDETKIPNGYKTGPDAYHCGVVDEDGYIIHSSPNTGVRKDMTSRWTQWDYWGLMKQVEYSDENVSIWSGDGGSSDVATDDVYDYCETLTDRELLEAIYRAVVKD